MESQQYARLQNYIGEIDYARAGSHDDLACGTCVVPHEAHPPPSTLPLLRSVVESLDAEAVTEPIGDRVRGIWTRSGDTVMTVVGGIGFVLVAVMLIAAVLMTGDTKPRVVVVDPSPTPPTTSSIVVPSTLNPATPPPAQAAPSPTPSTTAATSLPPTALVPSPTSSSPPPPRTELFPRLFPRLRPPT